MVNERKLLANAETAKKGGPKTDEGKAIVKLNAVKHGLLCQDLVLRGEKKSMLNELIAGLIAQFQPQGRLEMMFVERLASSYWRLARVIKLETNYIGSYKSVEWAYMVQTELGEGRAWLNLTRYETSIERQLYKALHELQRLQMARQGGRPPAPIAIDVDVSRED